MLGMQEQFLPYLETRGISAHCPDVVQIMSEKQLIELVPEFDGWIIGDDPATRKVFEAGKRGKLKAAVKWGIGVDNVDFEACNELAIPITNTPNMFGPEVADVAMGYVIGLARETFQIDREIRAGGWPKNCGISLAGKRAGVVGYGDIGRNTVARLRAAGMLVSCYDPAFTVADDADGVTFLPWPEGLDVCDFMVFTCSLNDANRHILNEAALAACKQGIRIVNVARGPLIKEKALVEALLSGHVYSAALDVFEDEPLPGDSPLRDMPRCIFGSHNGSNTSDAVARTNDRAIAELLGFLGVS
jgi:D-3-phosphoglycerate dehydrogenase